MKKDRKYKKANIFIYSIFHFVSKIIAKFIFKLKVEKNELKKVKGPYVLICNHESVIDFINMASVIRRRVAYVISNSFYQSMKIQPLIKMCGVVPKQQFQTNVADMKKMKSVINAGVPLIIYPAGLMSENGITTPIPESTGKFLSWLGVDVYCGYTEGSYLTKPKWSKVNRKGKITLNITKILSKEELKEYSVDELQKIVEEKLYYDAYDNQEKNMVMYKNGSNVEGFENVLYWCPKCHKEFTNEIINANTIKCSACGNEVYADDYGFLYPKTESDQVYKHPSDWYNAMYDELYKEVISNPEYQLNSNTKISMLNYNKHKYEEVGSGKLTLNRENFILNGVINGVESNIVIPIKVLPILPNNPGKYFEIQDGNTIYRCYLEDGRHVNKWINVLKIFYKLNNKK